MGTHNAHNVEENVILCSSSGAYAGYISKYEKKVWASDCFSVKPKNNSIDNKYLYYTLKLSLQDHIYTLQTGSGQPHIYAKTIAHLKIPIPPIEHQKEIVECLDLIYEQSFKINTEKIKVLKQCNKSRLTMQKRVPGGVMKPLKEVCEVSAGTYIKPPMKIQGGYPVYGGGNISSHINQSNRENEIIVAKDGVSADCVRYEPGKFFLNHHGWTIDCKDCITKKYMFYALQSMQQQLLSLANGAGQQGINQANFYKLNIHIPTLEQQKEIVEYCEVNDTRIEECKKEIEQHKKMAILHISGIVKTVEKEENVSPEAAAAMQQTAEPCPSLTTEMCIGRIHRHLIHRL